MTLSIGDVAARAGVSVDTLRYYERESVLPPARRDSGGRRVYEASILDALTLVGALRAVGVGIADVRTFMSLKARESVPDRLRGVLERCDVMDARLEERARNLRAAKELVQAMRAEAEAHLARLAQEESPSSCGA